MKNSLTHLFRHAFALGTMLLTIATAQGQVNCPAAPYTNDAFTTLLDHFDGGTAGSVLAYVNDGAPCGGPRPSAAPNLAFGPGPTGLGQSLALFRPSSQPPGSGSYVMYSG